MLGRLATTAIALFWLIMMGLLFNQEILPEWRATHSEEESRTYDELEAVAETGRVAQMGVHFMGKRIGFILSRIHKVNDEVRIENRTEMDLNAVTGSGLLGGGFGGLSIEALFKAFVYEGELNEFELTVSTPPGTPPMVTVTGRPIGNMLSLTTRKNGTTKTESIPFDAKQLISAGFDQSFAMPELRVGARWPLQSLDTSVYMLRRGEAEVVDEEDITIDETTYHTYRIEISYGASTMTVWATANGEVVKQKIFGFTFIREEPPADALERRHL